MTDTTSGKRQIEILERTVECPRYKALCLSIPISECRLCPAHRGVEKVTEIEGVEIFDVLCGLPTRKRVSGIVREVRDGGSE